jgi:hypothetical protein
MKHTSEYNWSYTGTNSKGEKKFRHTTNESVEDVMDYFEEKGIEFKYKSGAHMFWIYYEKEFYSYYYTTGRWSRYTPSWPPPKHYVAKGIKDFLERFILKTGDNLSETH